MRIAILGDTHFGIHKNNQKFLDSQTRYFIDEFIPECKRQGIKEIFLLGDVFDNRQNLNIFILREVIRKVMDNLKEFKVHILIGNHDIYYNTEINVHSLDIFKDYPNVKIYETIEKIKLENREILMIPWQTGDFNIIDQKADICMGHLDICSFNMYKHKISESNLTPSLFFENFKLTFSGHFHIRSEKTNGYSKIIYVGSPYQLTRNDADEERGFAVLDLETLDYTYINNKKCIKFITLKYPETVTKEMVEGNVVDVETNFDSNFNQMQFNEYLSKIEGMNPIFPPQPKILNNFISQIDEKEINLKSISVESIISEFIKENNSIQNKEEIEKLFSEIYEETKIAAI